MIDAAAIFSFVANHVWQSTLLAAVLALLLAARRRLSAQVRHSLAFAALAAAALLPLSMLLPANGTLLVSVAPSIAPETGDTVGGRSEPARPVTAFTEAPEAEEAARPTHDVQQPLPPETLEPARSWAANRADVSAPLAYTPAAAESTLLRDALASLDRLRAPTLAWALVAIWLAVTAVLLVRIGLDIAAAERLRRRATPATLPRPLAHLVGALDVRESEEAGGPMVAGLLRPAIILPQGFLAQHGPHEIIGLMEHERAHVERGDVMLALLQRLLVASLWWSPAMHWIAARVEEEREMACDEAAAARVGDARAFARTLTEHAEAQLFWGWPRLVVGATRGKSQLGRRVRRLLERAGGGGAPARIASRASGAVMLAVVAAAALATPRLEAQPEPEGPAPTAPRSPAAPRAPEAPRAPAAPEAPEVSASAEELMRAEEGLARAAEALREAQASAEASAIRRAERGLAAAQRGVERAQERLAERMAETMAAAEPSPEALAEATDRLAEAQEAVEEAQERLEAEAEAMEEDPSNAPAVRAAAQDLADARRELRSAMRDVERTAASVEGRGAGRNRAGVAVGVRGPDRETTAEVQRAASALAEAIAALVGGIAVDVELDPEALQALEGLEDSAAFSFAAGDPEAWAEAWASGWADTWSKTWTESWTGGGGGWKSESPLVTAARMGNEDMVRLLVDSGAAVDDEVVLMAVRSGDADLVGYFLEAGADPNAVSPHEGTPLIMAVRQGDADMARALIEAGADPNVVAPNQGSPLVMAVRQGDADMVRLLTEADADPNLVAPHDGPPLMMAVRQGDADMVRALVEAGADVNAEVPHEGSPLTAAVRMGDVEIVRLLIELGADVEGQKDGAE